MKCAYSLLIACDFSGFRKLGLGFQLLLSPQGLVFPQLSSPDFGRLLAVLLFFV